MTGAAAAAFVLWLATVELTGQGYVLERGGERLTPALPRATCERALANRLAVAPPAVDVHPLAALTVEVRRDGTVLIRKLSCREVRP